jgi:hypothetical protein
MKNTKENVSRMFESVAVGCLTVRYAMLETRDEEHDYWEPDEDELPSGPSCCNAHDYS